MKKLVCLLFIFMPCPAYAATSSGLLPASLKMAGALLGVVGLLLLLYHFSRKGLFGLLPVAKSGAIKVSEMKYLMPKKAVCLVEVKGREFLLGVGVDRVELIASLDGQQTASFEETLQANLEEKQ